MALWCSEPGFDDPKANCTEGNNCDADNCPGSRAGGLLRRVHDSRNDDRDNGVGQQRRASPSEHGLQLLKQDGARVVDCETLANRCKWNGLDA